jgi:CheY-like chemotaxis protein
MPVPAAQVLIVEDDAQVRVLAEGIVQELGHTVLTAGTVDEAFALLTAEHRIDLLFTDLNLRDEHHGGVEVGRTARGGRPEIKVIYTSGEGVNDGTRALFVDGFLSFKSHTPRMISRRQSASLCRERCRTALRNGSRCNHIPATTEGQTSLRGQMWVA